MRVRFISTKIKLFCGFMLWLIIVIQTYRFPFPDARLLGQIMPVKFPVPALQTAWSGEYTASIEKWLEARIGFRGLWVKTANQINYSVFRETKPLVADGRTSIILGNNGWLYEYNYVNDAIGKPVDGYVNYDSLTNFRVRARDSNIVVGFIVTPSKVAVYPEHLPDKYKKRFNADSVNEYAGVIESIRGRGMTVIDGPGIAMALIDEGFSTFHPGDTHWNEKAVSVCVMEILDKIKPLNKSIWPEIKGITEVKADSRRMTETELGALLNLWWQENAAMTEVKVTFNTLYEENPPRVLMVGNSFCWGIAEFMIKNKLASIVHLYYYNRSLYSYPGGEKSELTDAMRQHTFLLSNYDVILLEANQFDPFAIGYGLF